MRLFCFVVVVVNVVIAVLIVIAVHKGLVVVDKSLSDTVVELIFIS